jgi:hypothetical protein
VRDGHCFVRVAGELFATTVFYDLCPRQAHPT